MGINFALGVLFFKTIFVRWQFYLQRYFLLNQIIFDGKVMLPDKNSFDAVV